MGTRDELKRLIDELPERDTETALRFLQFLRQNPAQLDVATMRWLDAGAEDAVQGIAAAEADVPREELADWLESTAAAVKPL